MGYKNEACTISGDCEYQGQTFPYSQQFEADEMELQSILLNFGAYYSPRLIGIIRPFFGCGLSYSLNTLYQLDESLNRTEIYDKGNCAGVYAQGGLELSTAYNYSVYIPVKYSYYLEGSFKRQGVSDDPFDPTDGATEYTMKLSARYIVDQEKE